MVQQWQQKHRQEVLVLHEQGHILKVQQLCELRGIVLVRQRGQRGVQREWSDREIDAVHRVYNCRMCYER